MRKAAVRITIAALILGVLVGVILIHMVYQPPPGRPDFSVSFLGYTNDVSGVRLARFVITNHNSSAVIRQLSGVFTQAPTEPSAWPLSGVAELGSGASETFTVRPPTNQYPWQVSVIVYPDARMARAIKETLAEALRAVRLKPQYRVRFYGFRSEWIESEDPSRTNSEKP
jgi:hypothetical protein